MKVTILYFAQLKSALGRDKEIIELPDHIHTLQELLQWLKERSDHDAQAFAQCPSVRAAIDHIHAPFETLLKQSCEIAFFPPVTGG